MDEFDAYLMLTCFTAMMFMNSKSKCLMYVLQIFAPVDFVGICDHSYVSSH